MERHLLIDCFLLYDLLFFRLCLFSIVYFYLQVELLVGKAADAGVLKQLTFAALQHSQQVTEVSNISWSHVPYVCRRILRF